MVRGFALALETTMAPSASWTGRCKTISMILCFSFLQFYFEGAGCGSWSVCGCSHYHHPHPCLSLHVEVSSINQLWLIIIVCCSQTGINFGSRDSKLSDLSPSSVRCVFLCFTEKSTPTAPKYEGGELLNADWKMSKLNTVFSTEVMEPDIECQLYKS